MIRRATEADMPELMRMARAFHYAVRAKRWATFEDSISGWCSWFRQCIERPDLLCLLAERDGAAVGMTTAFASPAFWNPKVITVCETVLWVEPDARGLGVGGSLIDAIGDWAKERGASMVAAGSSVDLQPKAMGALMRKKGFVLQERVYSRRTE